MSELNKLINENKARFEIDKVELAKKIEFSLVTYDMVQPPTNLESAMHARVKMYYQTLQAMLINSTDKLASGYKLDITNSKQSGGGYTITFLKGETEQAKDKVTIKKQIKTKYLEELEEAKQIWIEDLTASLAKKAEIEALAEAQNKTKLIQDELTALLATKSY